MKKTLLIALVATLFFSCKKEEKTKSQKDIVKENVSDYLKDKLDDPESYEFVELKLIDSTLYIDNINSRIEGFEFNNEYPKKQIENEKSRKEEFSDIENDDKILEYEEKIKENNKIIKAIDSVKTAMGDEVNDVAAYKFHFKFRTNNAMGAKVLNEYVLQTTPGPDYKVLQLENNKDRIILTPNEFPGYHDIINRKYAE